MNKDKVEAIEGKRESERERKEKKGMRRENEDGKQRVT